MKKSLAFILIVISTIVLSACVEPPVPSGICGDGVVDLDETCDAGQNNGAGCTPQYGESCEFCNAQCEFTTVYGEYCGDGTCNGPETYEICSEDCPMPEELEKLNIVAITSTGSFEQANPPGYIIDQDLTTRWASQPDPLDLTFDLGAVQEVEEVKLSFYKWDEGRVYTYSLYTSEDNNNWNFFRLSQNSANTQWTTQTFPPVNARYVRIYFESQNQNDWAGLWEAEIYGNQNNPVPCIDNDGDGRGTYCSLGSDCNDNNPAIWNPVTCSYNGVACGLYQVCGPCLPVPSETCGDNIDNDCDGTIDEGCSTLPVCGNNQCETGETCSSCQADCGACPPAGNITFTKYVTVSGAGTHSGTSPANAMTLREAATSVQPGDVVSIAPGNYGITSSLSFNVDGTSDEPILWIGTVESSDFDVNTVSVSGSASTILRSTYANNGAINFNGDHNIFKNMIIQQDTPAKVLLYVQGNYVTLEKIASKYPSNQGSSSNHLILVYGHHVTIRNSTFNQGPRTIIWVRKNSGSQADYFLMEYSVMKGATNHPPIQIFPATNSMDPTTLKRPIVRNNLFIDNPYSNLYTRYCEEFAFYNNIFIRSGTPYDIDKHTGFHYPTGLPEDVMDSSRGIIAYNTIIENGDQNIMGNVGSNEVSFVNNIYYSTWSGWSSDMPFRHDGDWNAIYNHRYDYNLYYYASVPDAFTASNKIRGSWGSSNPSVWFPNWRSVTGQEAHTITTQAPTFKNVAQDDYSPASTGSPQVGKGTPVTVANGFWMDITTDYYGNPRDPVHPTIGAIENP